MGRLGVTKDDVFTACKKLLKEGANLTVANVREELGTGSYTTILPLIDAFKAANKAAAEKAADGAAGLPALPSDLGEQGGKFIQDIWWQAMTFAQKRIDEVSTQFKKELEAAAAQLAAKNDEFSQAVNDITRLEKDMEQIKADSDKTVQALNQKDGEIGLLKSQLKDKDTELKAYLERAIAAEKKMELLMEDRSGFEGSQGNSPRKK